MRLEWTEVAVADLENIRDYIKKDSEHYAIRFVEKIIEAVEKLLKFPEIGRAVPEAASENIRELIFHNYRIMYHIEPRRILILTIMHGARELSRKKSWDIV